MRNIRDSFNRQADQLGAFCPFVTGKNWIMRMMIYGKQCIADGRRILSVWMHCFLCAFWNRQPVRRRAGDVG